MPNQKNNKGKKSKRTNSSGDEQENGACAAVTGGAAAAAAPRNQRLSEGQCATPLGCSLGRPIDLEKDDYQRVLCNNELCPYGNWMHLQCFYEWESSILVQFNCIGRARSWNEKQCRQNMWTKKGYDLAFRFCSCRCGQGHIKKDTDWYQVKRMQDERKKKPSERSTGRNGASGGAAGSGDGLFEEPKKSKQPGGAVGGKLSHRASSQELPRRQSVDRQNSSERGAATGGLTAGGPFCLGPPQKSPCDSPGQSPPAGFPFYHTAVLGSGGGGAVLRGSRPLGEFLKSAVHMDPQRKHLLVGGALSRGGGCSVGASSGAAHLDPGSVLPLPLSFALPLHHRLTSGSTGDGTHSHPVQFLRRLDLSELLTHIPRHKLNAYHVRMEDDAQAGQGEDLRRFILSALSASQRNVVNCALCHRALPVFEQFPLVDGTLFLSPSRHDEIEYDVPCHLQGAASQQHLHWNLNMWRNIMFSDESRLCLQQLDHRVRRRGERYADCCTDRVTSSGGGSVMVWGGISLTGRTRLVIIGDHLNAERYRDEILQPVAIPYLHSLGPNSAPTERGLSETTSKMWEWRGWNGLPAVLTSTPLNTCGSAWARVTDKTRLAEEWDPSHSSV